jgi:hypothetical protein
VLVVLIYLFFGLSYALREFDMPERQQLLFSGAGLGGGAAIVAGLLLSTRWRGGGWFVVVVGLISVPATVVVANGVW